MRPMGAFGVVVLLLPLLVHAAATTTQTTPKPTTRPDPHLWAKRNVELIRQATTRNIHPLESGGVGTSLGFSLEFNPLLKGEPYAGEILKILEAALIKPDLDPKVRDPMQSSVKLLRLPPAERAATARDAREAKKRDERHAAYRNAGDWGRLASDYRDAAHEEQRHRRPEQAGLYLDHLLALAREHPPREDSEMADALRFSGFGIAQLAMDVGREAELNALMPSFPDPLRVDMLLGYACAHIEAGRSTQAREIIDKQIRPLAPAVADHAIAALSGRVPPPALAPPPSTTTFAPGVAATQAATRAAATRMAEQARRADYAVAVIANARAKRGDIDMAMRLLERPKSPPQVGDHDVAYLAKLAGEAGNRDAAVAAFERALERYPQDTTDTPEEIAEKTRFIREAIDLGAFDIAYGMFATVSPPGAYVRHQLARAHLKRGDNPTRADALLEEALAMARTGRGAGNLMAEIAVDLHAAGQRERAEQLLIDAMDHIEGVDFGFSGTAAIVSAAMKMNRLDLLDRCYETYDDPGEKLLLCIVATRAGLDGDAINDDD